MKVLFIRFSSLGDIVLTTGILKQFHTQFPDADISVLTGKGFEPVFEGLDFIQDSFGFDRKSGFSKYIKFLEALPGQTALADFDYIIDLHANLRSKFIHFSSGATYLSYKKQSFKRRMFVKHRWFQKELQDHVATKYFLPIAQHFNVETPSLETLRPILFSENVSEKTVQNHVVIHGQASKATKKWPYFIDLARALLDRGKTVTVVGTAPEEIDLRVNNLTGKTTLTELIDVMSTAETVITTDSGPMHIGVALGKKVIVLAGPTTKEMGFLPAFEGCTVIEEDGLPCRPCHVHGTERCPKDHFKCMTDISVDRVMDVFS